MPTVHHSSFSAPTATASSVHAFQAATLTECLLLARKALGPDAEIVAQRKIRKGAWFGRWGGQEWMEVTCRLGSETSDPLLAGRLDRVRPGTASGSGPVGSQIAPQASQIQMLEARLAELTASVQGLLETSGQRAFQPVPVTGEEPEAAKPKKGPRSESRGPAVPAPSDSYPILVQHLLDAEVAAPLARQWVAELPKGLSGADARTELRTYLAQRLIIDAQPPILAGEKMRVWAFVGTTGVGKTTTIAKIAARHAVVERQRVGILTLDTFRIAASQQIQAYGEVLNVPVRVAHDPQELHAQLAEFAAEGTDLILLDTTGRSPNDMIPLGETADIFDGVENLKRFLTLPATLSGREMEHVVARFRHALAPEALILTKLDEATDNACFGKLLTVQAKYGLPLAYVTTGQKVPDDITVPDAHAIAARVISTALL